MGPSWASPGLRHTLFLRLNKPRPYKKTASFFTEATAEGSGGPPDCCRCGYNKWKVEGLAWKERSEAEPGFKGRLIIKYKVISVRCAACGEPY